VKTAKLATLAKVVRSKNAGPDKLTFDIIFADRSNYERVVKSGALTRTSVARLYGVPETRISDFVAFDPGLAIKFTMYRLQPSGSPGERDILGAQQYAPLLDVEIPVD
jgi:hypothetical protein